MSRLESPLPAYSAGVSQSTAFTPSTGDDIAFPSIDSPLPQPKEGFFKLRRAPLPTPASRPTRELDSHSEPDTALDPEGSDVINDSIEPSYRVSTTQVITHNRTILTNH